jgi:hypothetical protein
MAARLFSSDTFTQETFPFMDSIKQSRRGCEQGCFKKATHTRAAHTTPARNSQNPTALFLPLVTGAGSLHGCRYDGIRRKEKDMLYAVQPGSEKASVATQARQLPTKSSLTC